MRLRASVEGRSAGLDLFTATGCVTLNRFGLSQRLVRHLFQIVVSKRSTARLSQLDRQREKLRRAIT
jgi:hypothetical protein